MLALLVGVLAVPAAFSRPRSPASAHAAVYAVVLSSGSAAVLLPAVQESGATGTTVFTVMAQVTIADVVTILSVPIVLQPGRTTHALLGGLLVVLTMVALLALALRLKERDWVHDVRRLSKRRHWALDLRLSLLILFLLAWIAQRSGTSVLIAGFAAGVMVALIGGPKRLSTQMRGIADGFFVPLYFVLLGAQLDLRGLFSDPTMLALACALAALNVVIHLLASSLRGLPASAGLTASAQLGVPAAVASLGLAEHLLSPQIATAIVAAALVSLVVCTLGVESLLAPRPPAPGARQAAGP